MSTKVGWSDDPIRIDEDDTLARWDLAKETAQLIDRATATNSSKVFGLTGAWGSGKTSLALLIEHHLKDQTHFSGWRTAHFTPWAATDTETMMAEFLAALVDILPGDKRVKGAEILGKAITFGSPALAGAITGATGVPGAGAAVKAGGQKLGKALTKPQPWDKTFRKLSEELVDSDGDALILVDDIDRLDQEQLALLLKIIRLLGRFPSVHYLLMYDEQTLFETLSGARGEESAILYANRYMEKIVQYQIPVPPMSYFQRARRLQCGLDAIAPRQGRAWNWEDRIFQEVQEILPQAFATPRGIDRYLVQLERVLSLHRSDEIDDASLMLLTVLQTEYPTVYLTLPQVKGHVTYDSSKHISLSGTKQREQTDWGHILHVTEPWDRSLLKEIINILFPATRPNGQTGTPMSRNSIRHADYFDRYFVHSIHGHDVPDSRLAEALDGVTVEGSDHTSLATLFAEMDSEEQQSVALDRLIERTVPRTYDALTHVKLALVAGVAQFVDALPSQPGAWGSPHGRARSWLTELLTHIDPDTAPAELENELNHVNNSVDRCRSLTAALRSIEDIQPSIDPHRDGRTKLLQKVGAAHTESLTDELFALIAQQGADSEFNFRLFHLTLMLAELGDVKVFQKRLQESADDVPTPAQLVACFTHLEMSFGDKDTYKIVGFNTDGIKRLMPDITFNLNGVEQPDLDPYNTVWENILRFSQASIVARA